MPVIFEKNISRRWLVYFAFLFLSQAIYQIGVLNVQRMVFDEEHYVVAARELLAEGKHQIVEHPPLGIELIAVGIVVFGDNPYGWRVMSMVAGSLLVWGMLALCFICGMRLWQVVYVGVLCLSSHFIFIHARLAMLDVFLCALIIWALVSQTKSYFTARVRYKYLFLFLSALFWGLAMAVKWVALVGFVICIAHLFLLRVVREFEHRDVVHPFSWHNRTYLRGMNTSVVFAGYVLVFSVGYSFPYLFTDIWHVPQAVAEIWTLQSDIVDKHDYASKVWQWPLMMHPIWYEYVEIPKDLGQAIFCLGNPFILVAGLISVLWSLRNWIRSCSMLSFINVTCYLGFYLFWFCLDRLNSFHYYYFLPAIFLIMSLGESMSAYLGSRRRGWAWLGLTIAVLFFLFYYPIISGTMFPINRFFDYWVWFDAWI